MTYSLESGVGLFHCDSCPEHIECDECPDFDSSREYAYRHGWRTYRGLDKLWANACPVCTADFAKEQRR